MSSRRQADSNIIKYDMAKSANKRNALGTDAYWDKPTHDPPLWCENWRVQYKLVLLANENIILDTLLGPNLVMVELTLEPVYKETIIRLSAQSERERNARNAQQKINWQNKCQRLIEKGIMCGDKPWPLTAWKRAYFLYFSIGARAQNP